MSKLTQLQEILVKAKGTVDTKEIEALEVKNTEMETKANEVYHTTNTNYGAELIQTNLVMDPVIDMIYKTNNLLSALPGNHGTNMPISAKVPVIGEATLMKGNAEYTTGGLYSTAAKDWFITWEVTITQAPFIAEYFISDRELTYAVWNLESIVRTRLAESVNRTISAYILNADSAASWNVNDDGWTPATTLYYKQGDNGIRKLGIANTVVAVSTLSDGDFLSMINVLWNYASSIQDLLFLMPANVNTKSLWLDSVKTIDKFWPSATISTWVLSKIYGIDNMVLRDFPALSLATGKVHTSTGNDYGSMALIYKPAIQYGFGKSPEYGSERVIGKWTRVVVAMEFGFAIANSTAGFDKTVALGAWITMS